MKKLIVLVALYIAFSACVLIGIMMLYSESERSAFLWGWIFGFIFVDFGDRLFVRRRRKQ